MADSFAKKAALDVGELGASLRDTAAGFAQVSQQVERFAAAREANISVAQKELAVLNSGLSTAKALQTTLAQGRQTGAAGVRTTSQGGGGGVRTTRTQGGGGVLAGVNGKDIADGVLAGMGRSTSAGERGIKAAINSGFNKLDKTIRTSTQRNDGGAAFRANGGV